jgi:uncharacterized protein (TIGR01777 family)
MRVVITGGSGLIGRALAKELSQAQYEVVVLSRNPEKVKNLPEGVRAVRWDGKTAQGWGELTEEALAIINLAGENLGGNSWFSIRWTKSRKERIVSSRVNAGRAVVEAVKAAKVKPQVVLQVSGVGYYGPRGAQPVSESEKPGSDFMASICIDWEEATRPVETLGVRRVVIRLGVVLSLEGGALPRQMLPFKLFVGGAVGSGEQGYPWIHKQDAIRAMRFLIENPQAQGTYNLAAPGLTTNRVFGQALAKVMHRPFYFPVPEFGLRMAFGEAASALTEGQLVDPGRIQKLGFVFKFPEIEPALQDTLKSQY